MSRVRIVSGTPWEPLYGYARAVRVGAQVFVSGTTATLPGGDFLEGDAAAQTMQALRNIERGDEGLGLIEIRGEPHPGFL